MTLDGVAQAPGAPQEDTSGGFRHGGWHLPYFDDLSRKWVADGYTAAGGFLFGRRTFESLAGYWPHASEEEQVIAEPLNTRPKYVASTTLTEPLAWQNSTLLQGDVAEAVAALKRQEGGDLLVVGSTQLVQTLLAHGLVDELQLMIDPLVVGHMLYNQKRAPHFLAKSGLFDVPGLGWLLRAMHNWGSNFMVAIMILHLAQVFLFGAFKYPREMTWISGVVLLLCTLGMAFTGQVLRFDQDAYWGLGIGAAMMGRVPVIGPELVFSGASPRAFLESGNMSQLGD